MTKKKVTIELEEGQEVVIRNKKEQDKSLHTYILLDRSGSMGDKWEEAVNSINAYVKELKKEQTPNDTVTLAIFDTAYDVIWNAVNLSEVPELATSFSSPRGMTALFDSTAQLIATAVSKNKKNSVLVIMTDGAENCSRNTSKAAIQSQIKDFEGRGWQVVFLGANFDASGDAVSLGLDLSKTFNTTKASWPAATTSIGAKARAYSMSCGVQGMSYTDDEKAAFTKD